MTTAKYRYLLILLLQIPLNTYKGRNRGRVREIQIPPGFPPEFHAGQWEFGPWAKAKDTI